MAGMTRRNIKWTPHCNMLAVKARVGVTAGVWVFDTPRGALVSYRRAWRAATQNYAMEATDDWTW